MNYFTHSKKEFKYNRIVSAIDDRMGLSGWLMVEFANEVFVLCIDPKTEKYEGYLLSKTKILKVYKDNEDRDTSLKAVDGEVDLDNGSRFEGLVLKDEREGEIGIPFGYGEMYDDDGLLLYKGIMINWKRFGYGTSYHDNGLKEYEGYWCDDNRFGIGKVYDRYGKFVKECLWYNGAESDIYEGNGSEPINIGIKHLKLTDNCVLTDWDVSWFYNLESIEIGNDCFGSVKTFKIDGLNRLKTIKIGKNSFTQEKNNYGNDTSKSFRILNCESLESIQIGEYSFSDFAGEFELKSLGKLESIRIGYFGYDCYNFFHCSCKLRGRIMETY